MIRRRTPRALGRHRAGQPRTAVHHRLWDGPARAEAERLGQAWPGWTVLYGLGSRLFYAIAAWPAPEPLILHAPTAEGLEERMREAEIVHASFDLLPAALERRRRIVSGYEPLAFRAVPAPRRPIEP